MTTQMPPMARPPSSAENGGYITSQVRDTALGPNRQVQTGYTISFKTGKGQDGSIFIADQDYSAANVIARARAAANELDQVHQTRI